jgi:hypothetical protein
MGWCLSWGSSIIQVFNRFVLLGLLLYPTVLHGHPWFGACVCVTYARQLPALHLSCLDDATIWF